MEYVWTYLHYVSVDNRYISKSYSVHKEQEYYIQSGGSCSVNYY